MVWIIFLSCSLPLGYLETVLISNRLGECKSFSAVPGRRCLPRYSGLNFSCIIQKLWRPHCHAEPILWPRPIVSAHSHRHHRTGCCRTKNIWPCSSFVPTHHFPTLNVWCSFYFLLGSKAINSSLRLHPITAPVPAGRNNSDLCGIWLHCSMDICGRFQTLTSGLKLNATVCWLRAICRRLLTEESGEDLVFSWSLV